MHATGRPSNRRSHSTTKRKHRRSFPSSSSSSSSSSPSPTSRKYTQAQAKVHKSMMVALPSPRPSKSSPYSRTEITYIPWPSMLHFLHPEHTHPLLSSSPLVLPPTSISATAFLTSLSQSLNRSRSNPAPTQNPNPNPADGSKSAHVSFAVPNFLDRRPSSQLLSESDMTTTPQWRGAEDFRGGRWWRGIASTARAS